MPIEKRSVYSWEIERFVSNLFASTLSKSAACTKDQVLKPNIKDKNKQQQQQQGGEQPLFKLVIEGEPVDEYAENVEDSTFFGYLFTNKRAKVNTGNQKAIPKPRKEFCSTCAKDPFAVKCPNLDTILNDAKPWYKRVPNEMIATNHLHLDCCSRCPGN